MFSQVFNMQREFPKRRFRGLLAGLSIALAVTCAGCENQTEERQNEKFREFTSEIFCQEAAANTVSLHYTLKDPQKYGISEDKVTFGKFTTDGSGILASGENLNKALEKFSYEKLTEENQLTYDVLQYCVEMTQEGAKYLLYEEPLGVVSGVQTQVPVVLSEYPLRTGQDVNTYLALLKTMPDYFDSLIEFEKKKAEAGLFMADYAVDEVMRQCNAFLDMGENNYLISTFVERVKLIEELTEEEKSDYMEKNALMIRTYVMPAYRKLTAALQEMRGKGTNEKGLCYLPEGKTYYEYLVRAGTGSERSVEDMKLLTKQQILADLEAMEAVLGEMQRQSGGEDGESQSGSQKSGSGQNGSQGESGQSGSGQNGGRGESGQSGSGQNGSQGESGQSGSGQNGGRGESGQSGEEGQSGGQNTGEENRSAESASVNMRVREAVQASAAVSSEFSTDPLVILKDLQVGMEKSFPALKEATYTVKYVPKAMEEHLSPAFYMIPAIDDYKDNVIYVNQAHMGSELTLFTTLAHEGYPGHLYQTVYFAGRNPDPVRSVFNFGGYVEGWATYAEMCSYYLTPLPKEQATLLQKNASIMLGLYTLADIGIHYDGWSRMDTVAFFSSYGIGDVATIEKVYELIIGSPGNYLRYYVGYLEFLEMKKEWAAREGEAFSQREFHEAVLDVGPAPFEIVRKYAGAGNKGSSEEG